MHLIHVLMASPERDPGAPARLPGPVCGAFVEHVAADPGPAPGTTVLTAFVRAPDLAAAELRALTACAAMGLDAAPPWTVLRAWPGLVAEYYEAGCDEAGYDGVDPANPAL